MVKNFNPPGGVRAARPLGSKTPNFIISWSNRHPSYFWPSTSYCLNIASHASCPSFFSLSSRHLTCLFSIQSFLQHLSLSEIRTKTNHQLRHSQPSISSLPRCTLVSLSSQQPSPLSTFLPCPCSTTCTIHVGRLTSHLQPCVCLTSSCRTLCLRHRHARHFRIFTTSSNYSPCTVSAWRQRHRCLWLGLMAISPTTFSYPWSHVSHLMFTMCRHSTTLSPLGPFLFTFPPFLCTPLTTFNSNVSDSIDLRYSSKCI